jgi:hypothetical protein
MKISLFRTLLTVALAGCGAAQAKPEAKRILLRPDGTEKGSSIANGDSVWMETGPFTPGETEQALVWIERVSAQASDSAIKATPAPVTAAESIKYKCRPGQYDFCEFMRRAQGTGVTQPERRELMNVDCRRSLYRYGRGNQVPNDAEPWRAPSPGSPEADLLPLICEALRL